MRDLHIGKHKLDIRFWREGEQTAFVIRGDPMLVERCDLALYRYLTTAGPAEQQWLIGTDPTQRPRRSALLPSHRVSGELAPF